MIKNFNEFIEESTIVGKGNYFVYIKPVNGYDIEKLLEDTYYPGHVLVKYENEVKVGMIPNSIIISEVIDKEHAEFFVKTISEKVDIEKHTIFTTNDENTLIKLLLSID